MAVTRLRITFDMYSGRPDPVITVTGNAAEELLRRMAPAEPLDPAAVTEIVAKLGYRGLLITQLVNAVDFLPASFRLAGGRLIGPGLRHWVTDPSVEDFICSPDGLAGQALTDAPSLASLAIGLAAIRDPAWWWAPSVGPYSEPVLPPGAPGVSACPTAPELGFRLWSDATLRHNPCTGDLRPDWSVQCCNNCYNYATNIRTDTKAQPGLGSGRMVTQWQGEPVARAAFYDGLLYTPTAAGATCIANGILVGLAVNPGADYHWYRKNKDGFWGHKPGRLGVSFLDHSGVQISDPEYADRGEYSQWYGYMTVAPGSVRIT